MEEFVVSLRRWRQWSRAGDDHASTSRSWERGDGWEGSKCVENRARKFLYTRPAGIYIYIYQTIRRAKKNYTRVATVADTAVEHARYVFNNNNNVIYNNKTILQLISFITLRAHAVLSVPLYLSPPLPFAGRAYTHTHTSSCVRGPPPQPSTSSSSSSSVAAAAAAARIRRVISAR